MEPLLILWHKNETNPSMFSVELRKHKHHLLYFKTQSFRIKTQSFRILPPESDDKIGPWIKGLEKLSNNFTLTDRATFQSNISV